VCVCCVCVCVYVNGLYVLRVRAAKAVRVCVVVWVRVAAGIFPVCGSVLVSEWMCYAGACG